MSLSNNNRSNKRIRCDDTRNNTMQLQLSDLPEGLLPKMASYLSNTSCVSFALSLADAPISQEPSEICKAIINASVEGWETLDFKDIQEIFGRSLTDNDIRWVLLAVDGANKIKSLKFTNCVGITGVGLQPLMGSTVLERIDLCLVGDHENPTLNPEPPISVSIVAPILNSIIEREDNVLVHVQLPKKWRVERSNVLTQFLQRFERQLDSRRYQCSKCGTNCETDDYHLVCWREEDNYQIERYGMVAMSCYLCKKNFCGICEQNCEGADFAMCCDKFYCDDCNDVYFCQGNCTTVHQATTCVECDLFKRCGGRCDMDSLCPECEPVWITCQFCSTDYCDSEHCSGFYLNRCQGEGCNRANCNGGITKKDCSTKERQETVRQYMDGEVRVLEFCGDCYPGGMNVLG